MNKIKQASHTIKRPAILLAALLALTGVIATSGSPAVAQAEGLVESGVLTICSDGAVPFTIEPNSNRPNARQGEERTDQWRGFDIDLLKYIAEKQDLEIKVVLDEFDGIWALPNREDCDVAAAGMTITDERAAESLFTDPYFDSDQSLLVKTSQASEITSYEKLRNNPLRDGGPLRIGTLEGTTGQTFFENTLKLPPSTYGSEDLLYAEFDSGNIDAVLLDISLNGQRAKNNDRYTIVAKFPTEEQYGFTVATDNQELAQIINQGLAEMKENGTYAEIFERYFGDEE